MVAAVKGGATLQLVEPTEQALALALAEFPEVIEDLLDNLTPSTLCEYLYTLSSKFNEFYGACKVLGSEQQVRPPFPYHRRRPCCDFRESESQHTDPIGSLVVACGALR